MRVGYTHYLFLLQCLLKNQLLLRLLSKFTIFFNLKEVKEARDKDPGGPYKKTLREGGMVI